MNYTLEDELLFIKEESKKLKAAYETTKWQRINIRIPTFVIQQIKYKVKEFMKFRLNQRRMSMLIEIKYFLFVGYTKTDRTTKELRRIILTYIFPKLAYIEGTDYFIWKHSSCHRLVSVCDIYLPCTLLALEQLRTPNMELRC